MDYMESLRVAARHRRDDEVAGKRLLKAAPALLAAAEAAIRYDVAIHSCANDPNKMASFCTAEGDDLDALYFDWLEKSRAGIAQARGES